MALWFKLSASYYLDPAVAALDDAGEVLFARSIAYAKTAGTSGFVPDAVIPGLVRRSASARSLAAQLEAHGLWVREGSGVLAGWQIAAYDRWQSEADELEQRRRVDADRQRRSRMSRDASRDASRDMSRDMSRDVTGVEVEVEGDLESSTNSQGRARPRTPARGTRIDPGWTPDPGLLAWAADKGYPDGWVTAETEQFQDYWLGNGKTKIDWAATWRKWINTSASRLIASGRPPPGQPKPSTTDQRVGVALALAAKYAAMEDPQPALEAR